MNKLQNKLTFLCIILGLIGALYVNLYVSATWVESRIQYQTYLTEQGEWAYVKQGNEQIISDVTPYELSPLAQHKLNLLTSEPEIKEQWVVISDVGQNPILLRADYHFKVWSLLPAFIAIALCLISREPLLALFSGIVVGAFMLGKFDISQEVLIPNMATTDAASILILYLWLLGGLMGIWSKTGAAQAFAEMMSERFVTGPRSAKLVTWMLGVLFFQGGTMSTVLVGTTVKPMADKANVSHEELSYVVDSTASPIAAVIAFNAWPAYIQAFIFVPGVAFLATEADRIAFFFSSIPFSFYGIFAVIGTLLLSLEFTVFSGAPIRKAISRARLTGQLDAPDAAPISAKELQETSVPEGYNPHWIEFVFPLVSLIGIAVVTFIFTGTPQIHWAFGGALLIAVLFALGKGMQIREMLNGLGIGWKGVVVASVILMLAITIGTISKQLGGGIYLVDLLGEELPFWILPVVLQLLTMIIAFSTGTSWGTFAIAFPLAMPLVWDISQNEMLANPEVFMMICFAAVLNGSVYGDQCSPISDTTILSSMTTGCDLMDHVKTQLVPATFAASIAAVLWTLCALFMS
ncbi:Na+/H+ antiporter NhaC family protein [Aliiglaciecola sp. 2_MG-2023]|uniref:Na+/H+ antiporter NhaC family protein n=1 Tax=Alteromonadaceae TaxID=72275 RepID=UPI0026E46405|nr:MULTISPECIES: Na+/H+ antiporter NhaC family protein [unclassified Aliiglaciecola]MDO6709510.1 Na+/H+ antiporter NhaC family protein [Aliiglaciecola sp. 2_MG-2023]MDO6750948.1 Na+/H+ antiporter NhaC family protein [Aliiglaciecola sp. 1_MG-2023]